MKEQCSSNNLWHLCSKVTLQCSETRNALTQGYNSLGNCNIMNLVSSEFKLVLRETNNYVTCCNRITVKQHQGNDLLFLVGLSQD